MSQRDSGYQRQERDLYETPAWVTEVLLPHLPDGIKEIWEPACGSGKMVRSLEAAGYAVHGTDVDTGWDFLACEVGNLKACDEAPCDKPPYALAVKFIDHAIRLMQPHAGMVAMLLRTDFDHAKTRHGLFGECPTFSKKIVLTKRIKWFEDSSGSPSFNHAWFIWDWKHKGPPTLAYGPVDRNLTNDDI